MALKRNNVTSMKLVKYHTCKTALKWQGKPRGCLGGCFKGREKAVGEDKGSWILGKILKVRRMRCRLKGFV